MTNTLTGFGINPKIPQLLKNRKTNTLRLNNISFLLQIFIGIARGRAGTEGGRAGSRGLWKRSRGVARVTEGFPFLVYFAPFLDHFGPFWTFFPKYYGATGEKFPRSRGDWAK